MPFLRRQIKRRADCHDGLTGMGKAEATLSIIGKRKHHFYVRGSLCFDYVGPVSRYVHALCIGATAVVK